MKNLSDYIDRGDVLFITEELTLVVKTGVYGDDILLFSAELWKARFPRGPVSE